MRTTVDLDEELIARAARLSKSKTKKALIEEALAELIRTRSIELLRQMIGNEEYAIDMTPEELRRFRGCDEPDLPD